MVTVIVLSIIDAPLLHIFFYLFYI